MRTSGTCRTADPPACAPAGFTLLELVVVLSIMGLAAGLAAPGMLRSIETWQAQAEVDGLVEQVRGLPARARAGGKPLRIDRETLAADAPPLAVPAPWTLETAEAWTVQANGYCPGGELRLMRGEREWAFRVLPPFCDIERLQ